MTTSSAGKTTSTVVRLLCSGVPEDEEWTAHFSQARTATERALLRLRILVEQQGRPAPTDRTIMTKFLIRAVIAALGLWIATQLVNGLSITDPITLLLAAVLLGVVNAFVRPILVILTLPISILTLGLFLLVINAGMLGLVALLLPNFTISGFFAAAARRDHRQHHRAYWFTPDQVA